MSGTDLNTPGTSSGIKFLGIVLRYVHLSKSHQPNAVCILDGQMDTIWSPKFVEPKVKENREVVSSVAGVGSGSYGAVAKW